MNRPLRRLSAVVAFLFFALFASTTWIQFVRADELNAMPGNSRQLYAEFGRERGAILVGENQPIATSTPVDDVYEFQREYSDAELYAHATGYYSVVYGTSGIERAANDVLSGTADRLFYRNLADLLTGAEPVGANVRLTLDPAVQRAAYDALDGRRGAVVALEPSTGDVLAMVSSPSYDPNRLATHDGAAAREAWASLLADEGDPLVNRAIAGDLYPPGSTFKVVTAAAALESGDYDTASELFGGARLELPQTTATIGNSDGGACGAGDRVTLADAMRISCNTAFADLGMTLGQDALREQAEAFGFGQDLSIPLGVTPSSFPADLNPPQLAQSSIGQFEVRVTPLQVAMVSAAIANDGVLVQPNLIAEVRAGDGTFDVIDAPSPRELGRAVSPETARELTEIMRGVVESGTGTRAQVPGVDVAGKTGTAQAGEGAAPYAWFTSFASAGDREVAVAVVIDNGGSSESAYGGRLAAPVAQQVMRAALGV
ncbi:peptidoglycan D,D-transpeptidase FtsI family protein [Kineococcus sp. SYSU DK004]|uniref:peptidoglycan D,D-transpeptidase FtsI family protein n=1 Tax=Kineococcus sp. SYSU DK004 TaxID=3383125 RepID=UPI003D7E1421